MYNVFPKFLKFKLYKKIFKIKTKLVNYEILCKKSAFMTLNKELSNSESDMTNLFSTLDLLLLKRKVQKCIDNFRDKTGCTHKRKLQNKGVYNDLSPCEL